MTVILLNTWRVLATLTTSEYEDECEEDEPSRTPASGVSEYNQAPARESVPAAIKGLFEVTNTVVSKLT